MSRKLESNEDLVADLMSYSPSGPLIQVFIIMAIQQYADFVIAAPNASPANGFISAEAWHAVALDVKTRMDAFYGRHTVVTPEQ